MKYLISILSALIIFSSTSRACNGVAGVVGGGCGYTAPLGLGYGVQGYGVQGFRSGLGVGYGGLGVRALGVDYGGLGVRALGVRAIGVGYGGGFFRQRAFLGVGLGVRGLGVRQRVFLNRGFVAPRVVAPRAIIIRRR